jgi:hypothetical protein
VTGSTASDWSPRPRHGAHPVSARILCYSLGPWFSSSESDVEVHSIDATTTEARLAELVDSPYAYFFEPTPYPSINSYDPIVMAQRLRNAARRTPALSVAFVCVPSPVPFEAQSAFAAQVGHILGSMPEVRRVTTPDAPVLVTHRAKAKQGPDIVADWLGAFNAAVGGDSTGDQISPATLDLVSLYLAPVRGVARFSPTQRRLLHRASTGEVSINAEEVAGDLNVQLVTAQRAIRGIALALFNDEGGRRSPQLVGQLVARYGWFFRYNVA